MNKNIQAGLLGAVGLLTFSLSVGFVRSNVQNVVAMRQQGLPLLAELPVLERRREILKQQLELSELQSVLRVGSPDEQVKAFVLPASSPVDRFLAALDLATTSFRKAGLIGEMSAAEIQEEQEATGDLSQIPVNFSVAVTDQGAAALRQFLLLAGRLTVADVLLPSEIEMLFVRVEADNPTGIVPLEQFLSASLLDYAKDPQAYETHLSHAIPQPLFTALLLQLSERSALSDVREIFGGDLGSELRQQNLWPLPLVHLQELSLRPGRSPGWWQATVTAALYRRTDG